MRDYLQRTEQFASYVYENPTILNKHRLALSDVVKMTQVLDATAFSTFASKYMTLFGTEQDQVMLEVIVTEETLSDLLALELMSVVEVKTNRFGYTSGKNFRIINIEYKLASNRIGFVLWGDMGNILIGWPNRVDSATLSGGSWQLPLNNLKNRDQWVVARSTDLTTTNTVLNLDLGTVRNIRTIALVNHNLSKTATWKISLGTTLAGAEVYTSSWNAAWTLTFDENTMQWEDVSLGRYC